MDWYSELSFKKEKKCEAGEMAQSLRALATLLEDPNVIPELMWNSWQPPVTLFPGDWKHSSGFCWFLHICSRHSQRHIHMHVNKNKIPKYKKRRKWAEHKHALLSASRGQAPRDQAPQAFAAVTSRPWWTMSQSFKLKETLSPFSCFSQSVFF